MAIDLNIVKYTANLARIELSAEELKYFTHQLDKIIEYINKLNQLEVEDISPTSHVLPLKNVFREDNLKESLKIVEVLKNTPQKKGDFFRVPKIIE